MDLESKYCYFYHSWDFVPYYWPWQPCWISDWNFVEDHPRNIPAKFGSNWPCGFGEEVWNVKSLQTTDDGRQVMAIVHLDLWSRYEGHYSTRHTALWSCTHIPNIIDLSGKTKKLWSRQASLRRSGSGRRRKNQTKTICLPSFEGET